MAIEGPLRELGIHDVFQLLDLSRKTGALRVSSALRDNEGFVHFHNGRIVAASIRSNPHPLGEFLVRAGRISVGQLEEARAVQLLPEERRRIGDILVSLNALTPRELERHVHSQIEAVVFELLSWQEGFFSFGESSVDDLPTEGGRGIATEALLMESARRIDEWARIADLVPDLTFIPVYAVANAERPSRLELLPNEWEVLVAVDGRSDVRAVAAILGRGDFDVAKIVYGLVSTGVLALVPPAAGSAGTLDGSEDDPVMLLADARESLHDGRNGEALQLAERAAELAPRNVDALVEIARALIALERTSEAQAALTRALEMDGGAVNALMLAARLAFQRGDAEHATRMWRRALDAEPSGAEAARAREAIAHVSRLTSLLEPTDA